MGESVLWSHYGAAEVAAVMEDHMVTRDWMKVGLARNVAYSQGVGITIFTCNYTSARDNFIAGRINEMRAVANRRFFDWEN